MPLSSSVGMSSCFHRARSSINNCWHINVNLSAPSSRTPQVFLAVSVLDALFQHPVTLQSTTPISMRDKAIVETFKWIAIAAVAQFAAHETDQDRPRTSQSRARDIAFTTWQKAREMLFQNIGATGSFRLALSLVMFGAILPPYGVGTESYLCGGHRFRTSRGCSTSPDTLCQGASASSDSSWRRRRFYLSS